MQTRTEMSRVSGDLSINQVYETFICLDSNPKSVMRAEASELQSWQETRFVHHLGLPSRTAI